MALDSPWWPFVAFLRQRRTERRLRDSEARLQAILDNAPASISGGTDICGCFVGGNPLSPVWRGEIQGAMLGVAVDVYDEQGKPVRGEKGELVCVKPFPSMPVMFWNDADGSKYHNAYFARFPGIWCHGDFAEITPHEIGRAHV